MASVLKHDQAARASSAPHPVAFNMEDVQSRAREYLAQVQREAQQLLQAAQQNAAKVTAEAKAEGLQQARIAFDDEVAKAAKKLSDERCRTAVAACETSIQGLAEQTNEWLAVWRDQTVELAARIAEKIVRREMQLNQDLLQTWIEDALVTMRESRDVRIFVHPDDFSAAGRFLQKLAKTVPQAGSVEVLPDPEIELGGCVVRSNHGEIDQQLTTQLARLVEQLT